MVDLNEIYPVLYRWFGRVFQGGVKWWFCAIRVIMEITRHNQETIEINNSYDGSWTMNPSSNMHRPTPPFGFITADNGEATQQNVKSSNSNWKNAKKIKREIGT